MSKAPSRILFSGDFLRPSVAGMRPTQHENINWLYRLLDVPVQMATGLPTDIVHWDNNWLNRSKIDRDTVSAIYDAFWDQASIQAWARVFGAETLPDPVEDLFLNLFADSFVIGFELPRYLVNFFARHDIGYVDCSLSPVRFMDDLLFEVSASTTEMTEAIRPHHVSDALIRLHAGILSSNVAKVNPKPPRPNSLLVILQTRFDKVIIQNGRFTSVLDHMDVLENIATDYDTILIKQHPLEPQPETLKRLIRQLSGTVLETSDNFYRLVAHQNVCGVAALSSSCVLEAGYFGKTGHYIIPDYSPRDFTVGQEGINVGDAVITPDFWRDVLASSSCPVTEKDGLSIPFKPNRFRKQLRSAWGYNQLDTDIEAQWANQK